MKPASLAFHLAEGQLGVRETLLFIEELVPPATLSHSQLPGLLNTLSVTGFHTHDPQNKTLRRYFGVSTF